jgi:nucleoside triphosphate pyrophosphatase
MVSMPSEQLILASASQSRADLLQAAGVDFVVRPSAVDESLIKARYRAQGRCARDCAMALAGAKAVEVSARHPEVVVIGADQILLCGAEWFDQPADLEAAHGQLRSLRGRGHVLETAACAVRSGTRLWSAASAPRLTMRSFGEVFLDDYLAAVGDGILGSVGGYRVEGRGIQLFERIEGDYFAILGLPLIPLLDFLRERGHLAT